MIGLVFAVVFIGIKLLELVFTKLFDVVKNNKSHNNNRDNDGTRDTLDTERHENVLYQLTELSKVMREVSATQERIVTRLELLPLRMCPYDSPRIKNDNP